MKKSRRSILTTKVYGFNPWMDQVTAINQIMEQTAQKSEAALLRTLIDEALAARRRRSSIPESPNQQPSSHDLTKELEPIHALLLKLISQGEKSLRAQGVSFMLIQETLAQAHSGRRVLWDTLVRPKLRQTELSEEEIEKRFEEQHDSSKDYAYSLAEELTKGQNGRDTPLEPRTPESGMSDSC